MLSIRRPTDRTRRSSSPARGWRRAEARAARRRARVAPPVRDRATPIRGASPFDAVIAQSYAGGWGVELAVYKNGALVYAHGYGLRDRGLPDAFSGAQLLAGPAARRRS